MAQCYHRKTAWLYDGGLSFGKNKPSKDARLVTVPCGKCIACRVNNAASWATRTLHESTFVHESCFLTLTYNKEHLPDGYNLRKSDVQLFLKNLRRQLEYYGLGHIRAFFLCGEYGEKKGRPHYHLILLGWCPHDLKWFGRSYSGMDIFTSEFIDKIWKKGFVKIGTLGSGSAAYVARYQKKLAFDNSGKRVKPFFLVSRNIPLSNKKVGGLGAEWLLQHHGDLRFGFVHHPTKPKVKCKIPDYYFSLLQKWFPDEYESLKKWRHDYAMEVNKEISPIDDHGSVSLLYTGTEKKFVDALVELLDLDDSVSYDFDDLLFRAKEHFNKLNIEQEARLARLKRQYDE